MTKRGIEESVVKAVNGASAITTTNGGAAAAAASSAGVLLADSPTTTPMIVDGVNGSACAVPGSVTSSSSNSSAYAHLNGVIDSSVVALMPDSKKIKVDHGDDAGGSSGSPPHSGHNYHHSSGISGISTVVSGGGGGGGGGQGQQGLKSRVVHLRNIPNDTSVGDLYQLASPFGAITKHLLVKSKHQAFVEFESPFGAMQMANYWQQTSIGGMPSPMQPSIRGRHIACQISNHKELNTKHFEQQGGIDDHNGGGYGQLHNGGAMNGDHHLGKDTSSTPSPVIRVIVDNLIYVVNLDNLYQIFSRAGKVLKIVTFTKNSVFQALVQFGDIPSAIQAKLSLDGQCMFSNGNVLRIEYSKLQNLIVKYNNEKSRDYTQPQLGAGNFGGASGGGGGGDRGSAGGIGGSTSSLNGGGIGGGVVDSASVAAQLSAAASSADHFGNLLNAGGGGSAAGLTFPGFPGSHHSNGSAQFAAAAAARGYHHAANSAAAAAGSAAAAASLQQALSLQNLVSPSAAMFAASAAGAGLTGLVMTSPVIHVSGLSTEHTTPDALFTLFGVYGDVIRVKILFNKKDTALIQMAEPTQAHLAISNLDRTRLYGKTLRVNSSKHTVVQMPKEGHQQGRQGNSSNTFSSSNSNITVLGTTTTAATPDSGLTKDYANSPLHRFKRPGSKNFNNIYPPSETLHVSNIPANVDEEELKASFRAETGKDIAKFKFFPNDHRMALVQFDCIENSILALIKMHNYKVAEHSHLRVSFSKSPV